MSADDYADLVLKDTFMIGVVIDCLYPTLHECTEQVQDNLLGFYKELVGVQFGKDVDPRKVIYHFRMIFK